MAAGYMMLGARACVEPGRARSLAAGSDFAGTDGGVGAARVESDL
ncbi:MAG: hypothetical protein WDA27_05835 [Actinomycetota bacterium]